MIDYASKVRALLAKANGTDNVHEKELFTAQAEKLMLKWGVTDAMLAEHPDEIASIRATIDESPHVGWYALVDQIARGLGTVRAFISPYYDGDEAILVLVVGFQRDLDRFQMLWESISVQAKSALDSYWQHYMDTFPIYGMLWGNQPEDKKTQFLISYGNSVCDRLRKERESVIAETTGADLVVIGRGQQIDDWVEEQMAPEEHVMSYQPDNSAMLAGWTGGALADIAGRTAIT